MDLESVFPGVLKTVRHQLARTVKTDVCYDVGYPSQCKWLLLL